MKIIVKSNEENFVKEMDGRKPNTVRKLDGNDTIEVHCVGKKAKFTRRITDITTYDNRVIISWKNKETDENEQ